MNCNELIAITLPDSLTDIGSNAFYGCNRLSEIEFKGTKKNGKLLIKSTF